MGNISGGAYIDVHTHILPNMDDGSTSIEESLVMIDMLKQNNVNTVIATSHYYPYEQSIESFINKRNNSFKKLKDKYNEFNIILGSETFLNSNLLEYNNIDNLCIEGTNYILIELPCFSKLDNDIFNMIQTIINDYQIIPIIAHIERYKPLKIKHVNQLINMGCLIQVNASSFFDKNSRKVKKLAKKGLIDFIGSDCHNSDSRKPNIECAMVYIEKKYNTLYKKLEQNKEKITRG